MISYCFRGNRHRACNITLALPPSLLGLAPDSLNWDSAPQCCPAPHGSGQLHTDLQLRVQVCCKQRTYEEASSLEAGGPQG
jgi:hypothetical protein